MNAAAKIRSIAAALKCWWSGHEPELRDDMKISIPPSQVDCGNGVTIRRMGRTFHWGVTRCTRCGESLYVEGGTVRAVREMEGMTP